MAALATGVGADMARDGERIDASLADLAQLADLVEEHRPSLLAMIERRLDPRLAAKIDPESVLQDAFIVARRRWRGFQENPRSAYVWLYGLVRDALFESWRRFRRESRDLGREMPWPERSSMQLGLRLVGGGTTPSQALMREEIRALVHEALVKLDPIDREVLVMRHFDELSHAEIAEILGIQPDAAMQRYARARRRIAGLLPQFRPEGSES
jgi:RNA polymerase sigma-70 factor (ECF subfamily)